jgi:hypothetical protein
VRNVYRFAMKRDNRKFNALRLACLSLCLLAIALGTLLYYAAFAPRHAASKNAVRHKGSRFVFADLDGDRIPDLALIETQRQRSLDSDYAIHVKLSAGAESAIGVSGPSGGLRVVVRDVNGDSNLDLIVTADLDAGFIKVLLNDGHGNFSAVAPTEFLRKENQTQVAVRPPAELESNPCTIATICFPHGQTDVQRSALDQLLSTEACSQSSVRPALRRAALLHFGRSPPAAVVLS